jgi:hypothetical protein
MMNGSFGAIGLRVRRSHVEAFHLEPSSLCGSENE